MGRFADRVRGGGPAEIAAHGLGGLEGGKLAAILSLIALALSGYSLWETSLKQAEVQVFVPPVIQYAAPYQNSNFEMIAVPVTLTNEGARTATVLSMELAVTDPRTKQTKRFYAADFGRWTMDRTRTGAYEPFAPLSLAGRSSITRSVLFYTRGTDQKPDQIVRDPGNYAFALILELAEGSGKPAVSFDRTLLQYDARAFNEGTLPLYSADWRSASNTKRE
jgi:hypothetical protein